MTTGRCGTETRKENGYKMENGYSISTVGYRRASMNRNSIHSSPGVAATDAIREKIVLKDEYGEERRRLVD